MKQSIDRRRFMVATGCAVCAAVAGCAGHNAPADSPTATIDIGPPAGIVVGMDARWAKSSGFFVVREGGRIFAVSSICTHRHCPVSPARGELVCDCHGSRFTARGVVLSSPATRSLPHLGISLNATGHLVVDRTRTFEETHWDDPGASVSLESGR